MVIHFGKWRKRGETAVGEELESSCKGAIRESHARGSHKSNSSSSTPIRKNYDADNYEDDDTDTHHDDDDDTHDIDDHGSGSTTSSDIDKGLNPVPFIKRLSSGNTHGNDRKATSESSLTASTGDFDHVVDYEEQEEDHTQWETDQSNKSHLITHVTTPSRFNLSVISELTASNFEIQSTNDASTDMPSIFVSAEGSADAPASLPVRTWSDFELDSKLETETQTSPQIIEKEVVIVSPRRSNQQSHTGLHSTHIPTDKMILEAHHQRLIEEAVDRKLKTELEILQEFKESIRDEVSTLKEQLDSQRKSFEAATEKLQSIAQITNEMRDVLPLMHQKIKRSETRCEKRLDEGIVAVRNMILAVKEDMKAELSKMKEISSSSSSHP